MADSKKYDGSTWEHSLRKLTTATEAIENPLYSDGTAITSYTISGNTVQNGTPTPSNPVTVQGVGNKTANLWNENYTGIMQDIIAYLPLNVGDGDYTLSSTVTVEGRAAVLFLLAGNVSSGATTVNNGVWNGRNRTVTAVDGYVTIGYRKYPTVNPETANTILNAGSTAKPYEPYGYKIPISSGGVTTNIYLGSTQTTRRIKKLVLTGQENITSGHLDISLFNVPVTDYLRDINKTIVICTHYKSKKNASGWQEPQPKTISFYAGSAPNQIAYVRDGSFSTVEDFKAYLAQQYANGTPVTVWYVLATPTTGVINEPLMKIGDYADTLSNATSIPTTDGANSITIDTTVQPSEFTATWTGWHNANVKEWGGSQWNE